MPTDENRTASADCARISRLRTNNNRRNSRGARSAVRGARGRECSGVDTTEVMGGGPDVSKPFDEDERAAEKESARTCAFRLTRHGDPPPSAAVRALRWRALRAPNSLPAQGPMPKRA